MKKILPLLILLFLFSVEIALADAIEEYSTPVDPNLQQVREVSRLATMRKQPRPDGIRTYLSGDLTVVDSNVLESGNYYSGRTWTVYPTGGTGSYTYQFYIGERGGAFGNSSVVFSQDASASNTMTYDFLVPGDYYFYCKVTDSACASYTYWKNFTVPADGHVTLAQRVNQIVSQCRAAGCTNDFDTALWLHDWLTNNVYYDLNYRYYSADSALLRGTCVCDGYSKAYYYLLEAAGIPVARAISENHAWNVVKLNGSWYHVDPTWDDPAGETVVVSGSEHHLYFGLPDVLIASDHGSYSCPVHCTDFSCNYFIHTGKVNMWVDTLKDAVFDRLYDSMWGSILDIPDRYPIEKDGYRSQGKEPIVYGLAAYQMSNSRWNLNDNLLRLDVSYLAKDRQMSVIVNVDEAKLVLPASLTHIEAQSFMDDQSVMGVEIPGGTTYIGALAFADCPNLWAVFIPDSVSYIDPTAFNNSPRVNIICHPNSYAERFADDNHRIKAVIDGPWGNWN